MHCIFIGDYYQLYLKNIFIAKKKQHKNCFVKKVGTERISRYNFNIEVNKIKKRIMWYCNSIENDNILVYKYNTDTSIKAEK